MMPYVQIEIQIDLLRDLRFRLRQGYNGQVRSVDFDSDFDFDKVPKHLNTKILTP